MSAMPAQKPGNSKQDYQTPRDFIEAVEKRFGKLAIDLAARSTNAQARKFVSPKVNSLGMNWSSYFPNDVCWLNPPFAKIGPWAQKCSEYAYNTRNGSGIILFLTPASVGSNWFAKHVDGVARVLFLQGRLTFVGATTCYPKDCILSIFGNEVTAGYEVWKWK